MFINNFDPVAFNIFTIEFRWYSLSYIIGILIGWYLAKKIFIKNDNFSTKFDDSLTYIIIGIIVGGRIGYVLIYDLEYYLNNLAEIFKIWNGGMSFHGGLIGIIISIILFSKKNLDNPYKYLDIISLVAPVGLFFGRIANFINSELYGYETSVPWAVKFLRVDDLYRHPTQLYEASFEGVILFLLLLFFWKKNYLSSPGKISALFLIFYSIFRFFVEFFRVPDEQLGYFILNLTMGQLLSILFLIFGMFIFFKKNEFKKK